MQYFMRVVKCIFVVGTRSRRAAEEEDRLSVLNDASATARVVVGWAEAMDVRGEAFYCLGLQASTWI